ncbi:Protein phosphatase methylesterase 1 [Channa argus]|uniref:Protein phosphatase methylesterase 1 n=1 Tax=Channa argus TaxID=215402 RepID=A0A6G1QTU6_CHAAH|nr:Protein phosphatase methylesterase 1 [Channa argus]
MCQLLHLNLLASRPPMAGGFQSSSKMKMGPGRKKDFSPLPWSHYFETMEDVEVESENGKDISLVDLIYCSGSHGPVLLLLHGGGHSALSWAVFTAVICSRINCRVVAMDLRAHGDTRVKNPDDLSADTMAKDIGKVVEALYGESPPPIMIIGHSMGGAIAVHTANANHIPSLLGLCVIDVVEGTAMDALNSMQNFLRSRPKTFKSLENAIEWSVKSGQIRNIESARVSMGGQVKGCEEPTSTPAGVSNSIEEGKEDKWEVSDAEKSNVAQKEKRWQHNNKWSALTYIGHLSRSMQCPDGHFRIMNIFFVKCRVALFHLLCGITGEQKKIDIFRMTCPFGISIPPEFGHRLHFRRAEEVQLFDEVNGTTSTQPASRSHQLKRYLSRNREIF